jgi:anti-sigma regulatory factor (Ser/Thr protein kinase)
VASQHWKAAAQPGEVARLRHAVADYVAAQGMDQRVVADVALAVSEVVANAVVHARGETIDVMATVNGDEAILRVLDDGHGMSARCSDGAGMGLAIAGQLARRLVIERSPRGGTEVRMTFAIAG